MSNCFVDIHKQTALFFFIKCSLYKLFLNDYYNCVFPVPNDCWHLELSVYDIKLFFYACFYYIQMIFINIITGKIILVKLRLFIVRIHIYISTLIQLVIEQLCMCFLENFDVVVIIHFLLLVVQLFVAQPSCRISGCSEHLF